MILSGKSIEKFVKEGLIIIEPFNPEQITTNSYDFRLGARCKVYKDQLLDAAKENPIINIEVNDEGIVLSPNRLYLFLDFRQRGIAQFSMGVKSTLKTEHSSRFWSGEAFEDWRKTWTAS